MSLRHVVGRDVCSVYWASVGLNMDSNEHGSGQYSTYDQLVGAHASTSVNS